MTRGREWEDKKEAQNNGMSKYLKQSETQECAGSVCQSSQLESSDKSQSRTERVDSKGFTATKEEHVKLERTIHNSAAAEKLHMLGRLGWSG